MTSLANLKGIGAFLCLLTGFSPVCSMEEQPKAPNLFIILVDDLGYGDVSCYNPEGKIATPHIDALAAEGMRFTNAHTPASVCTPTRYALLTGRYCWRTELKSFVLRGEGPPLIEQERLTLPEFLGKQGYRSAMSGKWHLGWDINGSEVRGGPLDHGFDTFFGVQRAPGKPPYVYVQNRHLEAQATEQYTGWWEVKMRHGKMAPDFDVYQVQPRITQAAVDCLSSTTEESAPFFHYVAMTAPHFPMVPTDEFQGKSGLNAFADFVKQMDADVGKILNELEKSGHAENTLVIFTADNGSPPEADFEDLMEHGHNSSGGFRGAKPQLWEGGHRVPFIIRWPDRVEPGTESAVLIGLNDIFRTMASILHEPLPENAAVDSFDFLPALTGEPQDHRSQPRQTMVSHSIDGHMAIQDEQWKLIFSHGGGNYNAHRDQKYPASSTYPVHSYKTFQLYDLKNDPGESQNLYRTQSEVVRRLTLEMKAIIENGRSTPGPAQKNEGGSSWKQISWIDAVDVSLSHENR